MKELRNKYKNNTKYFTEINNLKIRLYPELNTCIICEKKTNLLKTSPKNCYSFHLGQFTLIDGYKFCKNHKYVSTKPAKKIMKYQSALATEIVENRHRITFDLLVIVGLLRYRDHRQLEEIQSFLKCSSAKIDLPISTIGVIAKRFLEYCKRFHKKYEYKIKDDIKSNGGLVLQFDGTLEKLYGKLNFVLMDGLSGHLLASEMIESENYDNVVKFLDEIKEKYGNPLATMSDLKSCFLTACKDTFLTMVIFILCHYHFLRTFKDDFIKRHSLIKKYLTKSWKINSMLKKQLNILKKENEFKEDKKVVKTIEAIEESWKKSKNVLETYYNVLLWISKFKQDSSGKGIPFDLPYLDYYNRLMKGKRLIEIIFKKANSDIKPHYDEFNAIVNKIETKHIQTQEFKQTISLLKYSRKWFNRLRGTLFFGTYEDTNDALAPLSKRYRLTPEEAKRIPKKIELYIEVLNQELSNCRNSEKKTILTRLKKQIEKHKDNLHIPIIETSIDGKNKKIIPPRTNNFMESFFRLIKCLLRRNTGRSAVTKEFGSIGALLPFYVSMSTHETFKDIFDDEQKLTEEFASLATDDNLTFEKIAA